MFLVDNTVSWVMNNIYIQENQLLVEIRLLLQQGLSNVKGNGGGPEKKNVKYGRSDKCSTKNYLSLNVRGGDGHQN